MIFPDITDNVQKIRIPCCVQPKYDGECGVWTGGKLLNRYGRERQLPFCGKLPDIELAGEVYFEHGKRNFYQAESYLKKDSPLLKFVIFALYNVDIPFNEQLRILQQLQLLGLDNVSVVEGMNAYSHLEVEHFCEYYLKQGYEGAVIKPLQGKTPDTWVKFKPFKTIDLVVLGVSKKHSAIAVGRLDGKVLGHCSLIGKQAVIERIGKLKVVGETKEDYLISPEVVVEVLYFDVIEPSGHLRSPHLGRVRDDLKPEEV